MKIKNISNLELQVYVCSLILICMPLMFILGNIGEIFKVSDFTYLLLYDIPLFMYVTLHSIFVILVFFTKSKSYLWRFFNALHVSIFGCFSYLILFFYYYIKKDYTYNIKLAKILLFSLVFLCVAYLIVIGCLIYKFVTNMT